MEGADLDEALIFGTALEGAHWANTTCPDDSNSDEDGDTCEGHPA